MNTTKYYILLMVSLTITLCSCSSIGKMEDFGIRGNGNIVEIKRTISRFQRLEIDCDADIEIEQNTNFPEISISIDKNLVKYLTTSSTSGVLYINFDEKVWHNKLKIKLNNADYNEIRKTGSGTLVSLNEIKVNKLNLIANGESKINLKANCDSVIVVSNGKDKIVLEGLCNVIKVNTNSAKNVNAMNLTSKYGDISINSSGDCLLKVENLLKFNIQSSGDVINYIKANKVEPKISGSGEFIQR